MLDEDMLNDLSNLLYDPDAEDDAYFVAWGLLDALDKLIDLNIHW